MKLACIIVNYNDEDNSIRLAKTLESYPIVSKVVVVDSCSTKMMSFEKIQQIENEKIDVVKTSKNGGYSFSLNYGIRHVENLRQGYDTLMLANTDIEISEETIKACIMKLHSSQLIGVVAPRMKLLNGKYARRNAWKTRTPIRDMAHSTRLTELLFWHWIRKWEYSNEEYKQPELLVDCVAGACFFSTIDVIKSIDYFDEEVFLFYEEDILGYRLNYRQYQTYLLNNVEFTHMESQSIKKTYNYYKKMEYLFKSRMYYQKTYNDINIIQQGIFYALWGLRHVELLIEVPIRRLKTIIKDKEYESLLKK